MARVSFEQKATAMMLEDIRLRAGDLALAAIWFHLVMLIHRQSADGLGLRMGFDIREPNDIAKCLPITETQWVTQIEALVSLRLVTRDAAGSIGLPERLMPTKREIANRKNGLLGGRPRKIQVDPTPAADPRQTSAKLPIAGGRGAAAVSENPNEKPISCARAPSLSLASESDSKLQASQAISEAEFQRVGRAAFEIPFDPATDRGNWGVVRQWLSDAAAAGLGEADREATILAAVAEVTERTTARGQRPSHLGYFTRAVAEAIAAYRPRPSAHHRRAERAWEAAIERHWDRLRAGDKTSKMPVFADFLASVAA